MNVEVKMPYIGSCLSVNHYQGRRRGGGTFIKPETKEWMGLLTSLMRQKMKNKTFEKPVYITVRYTFKDRRCSCDPNNLHKVIADALQPVFGNDKDFCFIDTPPVYNKGCDPVIVVSVRINGR